MDNLHLSDIRTEYKKASLKISDVNKNPFLQFDQWFEEVLASKIEESNAMVLATVARSGKPSARVVLLKGIDEQGFYFYTNYGSRKGQELKENPQVAAVFFWKELERQVRIQGVVKKASAAQSDEYFLSRPEGSQIGAWASPQSKEIASREMLENRVTQVKEQFKNKALYRPPFWGGFCIQPQLIEFWQGRSSRLHDRIVYTLNEIGNWDIKRIAP